MPCKSSISWRVIRVEDLQKLKVVQRNDFIAGIAKMNKTSLKIFDLAVSMLNSIEPPKDNTVYIEKKLLFNFFDANDNNKYGRFKNHIDELMDQSKFHIRTESKKGTDYQTFVGISRASWNDYDEYVSIKFTDEIMVFLKDLGEGKFTQYEIKNISKMKHKHSITIYKWLVMHYNQYKYYEYSSKRNYMQKESLKNPTITMDELRAITDTKQKYELFTNFQKKVIEESLKEINHQTNLNVTYEKIKKGRKISAIKFFISGKPIKKVNPLEENYLEHRPSKEERERELSVKREKALDSDFTGLLLEYHIIKFTDLKNKNMLAEFYDYLYPEYEKLDQLKRRNSKFGLNAHLRYMQNELSKKAEQPRDLLRYLKTSAENYINRIKSEGL